MVGICVVGAGVVGLTSALNVKQTFPDISVTVVADKFFEETTSYGAGGLFRPNLKQIDGNKETIRRWIGDSWRYFDDLASSSKAKESGVRYIPGFVVYNTCQDDAYEPIKDLVYDFHKLPQEELQRRNLNYKYGYAFTSILAQSPVFLQWLMRLFLNAGGTVKKRTVKKLQDLCDEFDLIINCCGLNAQTLVGERNAFPIKGQLVYLDAPWINFFFLSEDDVYFMRHSDKLVVGGTREKGNYDLTIDQNISRKIVSRAEQLFPQLKVKLI